MVEMSEEKLNELAQDRAMQAWDGVALNGTDALLAVAHILANETHGNYNAATMLRRSGLLKGWLCWMRLERNK